MLLTSINFSKPFLNLFVLYHLPVKGTGSQFKKPEEAVKNAAKL